ncbi:MAG: HK97 family phage prohead protease [Pirellulales bacterium]
MTATKTETPDSQVKEKFLFARVKGWEGDELVAVASTGSLDRHGEIIDPGAWTETLDIYRANPVILATHLHRLSTGDSPVIGSASRIDLEGSGDERELTFRMKFAGTELGRQYEQLYRDGHMRAFSVGFIPLTDEMRETDVAGGTKRVLVITKAELIEISAVPVPANPDALVRMRQLAAAADPSAVAELVVKQLSERVASAGGDGQGEDTDITARLDRLEAAVEARFDELIACMPDSGLYACDQAGPDRTDTAADADGAGDDGAVTDDDLKAVGNLLKKLQTQE